MSVAVNTINEFIDFKRIKPYKRYPSYNNEC